MFWKVEGASQSTGEDVHLTIEAPTAAAAESETRARGVFISSLIPVAGRESSSVEKRRIYKWAFIALGGLIMLGLLSAVIERRFAASANIQTRNSLRVQAYSLRVKLRTRDDKTGDLVPVANCQSYLIPINFANPVDRLLDEYRAALIGKVQVMTRAGAKLVVFEKNLSDLRSREEELRSEERVARESAQTEAIFGQGMAAQEKHLNILATLAALEKVKPDILKQGDVLQAEYQRSWQQMASESRARFGIVDQRLRNSALQLRKSTSSGYCTFESVPAGSYVLCAIPSDSAFYWRTTCVVAADDDVFFGPADRVMLTNDAEK